MSLIFSPLLSDDEANDLFQQFVSFIQEQGGILEDQRMLGKRPLLTPIRHSKEGHLALVTFALHEEKLSALEKRCRETSQILRFFLMKQVKRAQKKVRVALPSETPLATPAVTPQKEEKIDMKDIDEKLEQIFKESP